MVYIPQKMKSYRSLFSFLYQRGSQVKNGFYSLHLIHPQKAPLPVISVGNITFGGSEKTPLVIHLASTLLQQGYKPAIITRGYKGTWEKKGGVLSNGYKIHGNWKQAGDEPSMMAQKIPQAGIFTGQDRLASCRQAKTLGFNAAILDDGFQHRKLHRNLDIVLFNPASPLPLREPLSSLKRAHILLLKKDSNYPPKELQLPFPQTHIYPYTVTAEDFYDLKHKHRVESQNFTAKSVLSFCGIAHPERFHSLLKKKGIIPLKSLHFPDHHPYPDSTIQKIIHTYQTLQPQALLTTEKDAVKIAHRPELLNLPVFFLKIDLQVNPELYSVVRSALHKG
ncbi:tetraacyldisaccharide 4'-kinase [bacterium]|nr:tetraacyldisaccharide 4'-kinase [bacterium]